MRKTIILLSLALAAPALAQGDSTGKVVGDIATQPLRDTNIKARKIPDVLQRASNDPYALAGMKSCVAMNSGISELNGVLGPDFDSSEQAQTGSRNGRVAAGVARGVVQGLIPFRGVVREVTGAASAERRYDNAVDAGIARRGFLRGTARAKGCRVTS